MFQYIVIKDEQVANTFTTAEILSIAEMTERAGDYDRIQILILENS